MQYISTRGRAEAVESAGAILRGLAPDGGLYLPEVFPHFSLEDIGRMAQLPYSSLAAEILSRWLADYTPQELLGFTQAAYAPERFAPEEVAPLHALGDGLSVLELFHGPTCAFKDFALQMLPRLLTAAARKCGEKKKVAILTATSGDTGKAALMGFMDVPQTCIGVFYPDGGTSDIQRLQMATQQGDNVAVFAVRGNFDDAQNGVKALFADGDLARRLAEEGVMLSSANSINWGRLAPQIVYYYSAYARLVRQGAIALGDEVNFCVPTGNFGNILAGYLAKKSGLPVGRLICASNRNNVLTDFIQTGVYDKNRPFARTTSPSMDILISSNLERLLYLLAGRDGEKCRRWMEQLKETGRYDVGEDVLRALRDEGFAAGWCDDAQAGEEIARTFRGEGYLCDTHTAVALRVARQYGRQTEDRTHTVVLSTASPFKFAPAILPALGLEAEGDEFAMLRRLSEVSGLPVPPSLAGLEKAPLRFTSVCDKSAMRDALCHWLEGGKAQ